MSLPLAITSYQVYLSIHILCAVLWVGGGTLLGILAFRIQRARSAERTAQLAGDAAFLGSRFFAPLSLILVIFGFILVSKGDWQWHFWLVWGMVFWALSFVVGAAFLGPESGKIQKLMADGGATAPGVQERISRILLISRIDNLFLLLVVLDMALKPGL
jgi:uncharacterized membrane protein